MKYQLRLLLLAASLYAAGSSGALAQTPAADLSWNRLTAEIGSPNRPASAPDWQQIAREADDFARNHPTDERAKSARRIALSADIRVQAGQPALSTDLVAAITAYLADTGNPVRDRLKLRLDSEVAKLQRRPSESFELRQAAKASIARALMQEFPGEPDGYGLLLANARTAAPGTARALAKELLMSSAPKRFMSVAQRVIEHADLLDQPLDLSKAVPALPKDQKQALVIYSWTVADEGFLQIIRRHAQDKNIAFVGINLDTDIDSAKAVSAILPGTQYFDHNGLDGPLARQLCLLVRTSLYLVDDNGVVRDVNGQNNPEALFAAAAVAGGEK